MAKILCIDDDQDILNSLKAILESNNHEVITDYNGKNIQKLSEEHKPDLFILDVMMEDDTEGFHTSYAIRKNAETRYKPIIMLSSINQQTKYKFNPETDGEFLPVDYFLEKPVSPKKLIEQVDRLLALPKEKINAEGRTNIMEY